VVWYVPSSDFVAAAGAMDVYGRRAKQAHICSCSLWPEEETLLVPTGWASVDLHTGSSFNEIRTSANIYSNPRHAPILYYKHGLVVYSCS